MADQRVVAVAGSGGFVGRAIVRELLSRGYHILGLVRDLERARRVLPRDERLKLIRGDTAEPQTLAPLVAGAAAVINAIGIIREGRGATFQRQHVESTRNLAQASGEAGAMRFVQISALGVTDHPKIPYLRTKFEAERLLMRSGLDWTVLRPSMIHGAEGEFVRTAKGWVMGEKQPWFFLPYFSRPIHIDDVPLAAVKREPARIAPVAVEDVAWAAAECLERPESIGEIINLAGPEELTWPDLLRTFRDAIPGAATGLNPLGIPSEAAAIQARLARFVGLGGMLPFDEGMALMGALDSVATADKARSMLGFAPRPFRESLKRYASRI